MTASAFLYSILAVLITAGLGGVAWLVKDSIRLRSTEGAQKQATADEKARGDRILKEKDSVETVHRNRPISDFDNSTKL